MSILGIAFADAASAAPAAGGPGWVVAVNLVIWSGLFLYLVRLERRVARDAGSEASK